MIKSMIKIESVKMNQFSYKIYHILFELKQINWRKYKYYKNYNFFSCKVTSFLTAQQDKKFQYII